MSQKRDIDLYCSIFYLKHTINSNNTIKFLSQTIDLKIIKTCKTDT